MTGKPDEFPMARDGESRAVHALSPRATGMLLLEQPVQKLKYVNASRQRALARLGITTLRDLVYNAPRRYVDFTDVTPIVACEVGQKASVLVRVDKVSMRVVRRRMRIVNASLVDSTGVMNAVWFNQPWVANALKEGSLVMMQGTVEHRGGFKQMNSPTYMVVEDEGGGAVGIRPVYGQTRGLTTGVVQRLVNEASSAMGCLIDPLPVRVRLERNVMSRQAALRAIHHPASQQQLKDARRRLAYEELLLLQLHWVMQKNASSLDGNAHVHVLDGPALAAFRSSLPYTLTDDQETALQQILDDMAAPRAMSRMLLGDVGTGKTVVAAGAFAAVADSASQGVLMAPTEVLARQYGAKIGPVLDQLGVRWATLTSSTNAAQRKQILAGLATGQVQVLFATHAVLEDDVVFENLSMVVIDEQHRFGVNQREKLLSKGSSCDYLCMTATPIPRSLALTVYGNLDCSYIRQRPGGNRDIQTVVMDKRNRFAAFDRIREAVDAGRQAYIICPLIGTEQSDDDDDDVPETKKGKGKGKAAASQDQQDFEDEDSLSEDRPLDEQDFADLGENLMAARKEAEYLQKQVFPHMTVGLLCGQMPAKEKAEVMERFRDGTIDVLVSTTVVEVGVDVPNATVMVVEDAERFGLSQLHQLRGRVGRGQHPGQCILLASTATEVAAKRMSYIESTQDGFELARLDLSLRHEGDVVGNRQHGLSGLRFSNVARDADLIEQARADALRILQQDPELQMPVNALLAYEVHAIYPPAEQE